MDVASRAGRPRVLGAMGGMLGAAFTLGPVCVTIAFFVADFSRRWVFVVASVFAFIGCLLGLAFLEETLPRSMRRPLCHDDDARQPGTGGGAEKTGGVTLAVAAAA